MNGRHPRRIAPLANVMAFSGGAKGRALQRPVGQRPPLRVWASRWMQGGTSRLSGARDREAHPSSHDEQPRESPRA